MQFMNVILMVHFVELEGRSWVLQPLPLPSRSLVFIFLVAILFGFRFFHRHLH
ncbi:hypothetical protein NC653_019369 [Populus alba x Populus x berolinensis]|uniref:Uncharacterized protein n=1 Tax=Populus alba x Populus x berolinensis TaxID=444605 RepID=A0AAD6QIP7_9ROSI|nr:hypothetical protein NC653_019369 [Populus alba x Populus x berolinensis]